MRLRNRFNIILFIVIGATLGLAVLSYLYVHSIVDSSGIDNGAVYRFNSFFYSLLIVSVLVAAGCVIMFRTFSNSIVSFFEGINKFTESMIRGDSNVELPVQGPDEFKLLSANLNKIADLYKEKVMNFEHTVAKQQRAVRETTILNELMGVITSEFNLDVILIKFVERTKNLIKSDYSAAIIFEPDKLTTKVFVTSEGIQNPSSVQVDPEGFFNASLRDQSPIRLSSKPRAAESPALHQKCIRIPELNLEVESLLSVPLTSYGSSRLSGLLLLANKLDGSFDQEDEDVLMNFAFQAFQSIAMHEEIANLAVTDGLTGLNNHRHFQDKLNEDYEVAKRYKRNLSLLILDVDNFKNFNDIYGHYVGDEVLKLIAVIIREQIRKADFAARYGGEEFAVIMPETNFKGAKIRVERLREKIAETPFILPNDEKALITVSIGFASIPQNTREKSELVEMADRALYFAKENGRNLSYGFDEGYIKSKALEDFDIETRAIENLARLIDSRSPYTRGHSAEVTKLALLIAKEIGLEGDSFEKLKTASILHDIGTVHIPEWVLNKPGKLTEEERRLVQSHPGLADILLKKYTLIEEVLQIIHYHHEHFDGKGYPDGIAGEAIPVSSRILAIAEAFHAMISPRPYKKKLTVQEAIKELAAGAGSQFDPDLIKIFSNALTVRQDIKT